MALTASLPAPRALLGIGLILAAVCCFATMDTTVRYPAASAGTVLD